MSDKAIVVIAFFVMAFLAIMAREAASVGKARAAVEVERVKACTAAGKQMYPVVFDGPAGTKIQEMECK